MIIKIEYLLMLITLVIGILYKSILILNFTNKISQLNYL
jgi:hypothetical protein